MSDLAQQILQPSMPAPPINTPPQLGAYYREPNPAGWTYERLCSYIKKFEENLDQDHEIGARLVSFGQEAAFHITNMSYSEPDIISFYGQNSKGENVHLVQNISQLSVLLVSVKKFNDEPKRIGFQLEKR